MGEERREAGGESGVGAGGFDWASSEDLTVLSVEELKGHLESFVEEEREVSYRRRVLQGRIDVIRAEIAGRGGDLLASPEDLARVLLGEGSGTPGPNAPDTSGGGGGR